MRPNGRTDRCEEADSRFFAIVRQRLKTDILLAPLQLHFTYGGTGRKKNLSSLRSWVCYLSTSNSIGCYVEIKCQLDATEVFIADLIACSTYLTHRPSYTLQKNPYQEHPHTAPTTFDTPSNKPR